MTWGSMLIGDDYDADTDETDADKAWVIKQLMQHPLFKTNEVLAPTFSAEEPIAETIVEVVEEKTDSVDVLDGWFEDQFGKSAVQLVKDLRLQRREHK